MPTYEYECLKCGYDFEVFQSMTAKPKKTCPKCKGKVRRLIGTGGGIIFKGSGFYATDYRKPETKNNSKKGNSNNSCPKAADSKDSSICKTCPQNKDNAK